jgi:hypothetical protein
MEQKSEDGEKIKNLFQWGMIAKRNEHNLLSVERKKQNSFIVIFIFLFTSKPFQVEFEERKTLKGNKE